MNIETIRLHAAMRATEALLAYGLKAKDQGAAIAKISLDFADEFTKAWANRYGVGVGSKDCKPIGKPILTYRNNFYGFICQTNSNEQENQPPPTMAYPNTDEGFQTWKSAYLSWLEKITEKYTLVQSK